MQTLISSYDAAAKNKFCRLALSFLVVVSCATLSACSKAEKTAISQLGDNNTSTQNQARYLAYQHHINIEVEAERLANIATQLQNACTAAVTDNCVILDTQVSTGRFSRADMKFRATANGVRKIMKELDKLGTVTDQSSNAEDLGGPIADTSKQQELLTDYRQRLEGLRERAKNDIDALIKVNKELAQVQNDLEALNGKYAHLKQRVETEILHIHLVSSGQNSFGAPIKSAFLDFSSNLAQATGSAITGVAYILPWSIMLFIFSLALRKLWRLRKTENSK